MPAIARDAATMRVLVVIGDAEILQLVGWIVQEMNLASTLTPTWREAIIATTGTPACIVADLDDVGDKTAGVAVVRKSCGGGVPLIVLSRSPDVESRAAAVGALARIRQPIDVRALMDAIGRPVVGGP